MRRPEGEEDSCAEVQRDDPVIGELHREHWRVPVHGLTHADPDGIVQAIARRDGAVDLHLTCGDSPAAEHLAPRRTTPTPRC
ncbi:MAG: hypothetical protein ACRDSN_16995, partial [Pseudonocardiaceae bacterium]